MKKKNLFRASIILLTLVCLISYGYINLAENPALASITQQTELTEKIEMQKENKFFNEVALIRKVVIKLVETVNFYNR
jgi:hypothetical protein